MKKLFLIGLALLVSLSPVYSLEPVTKEFGSMVSFVEALKEKSVLNSPTPRAVEFLDDYGEPFYVVLYSMDEPLVNVIIRSDTYQEIYIKDDTLRFILVIAEKRHVDLGSLLETIQVNPKIALSEDRVKSHRAIENMASWIYRIEALGYKPDQISRNLDDLPEDFFQ